MKFVMLLILKYIHGIHNIPKSYHFVVVRKSNTGPSAGMRGGNRESHVIGL